MRVRPHDVSVQVAGPQGGLDHRPDDWPEGVNGISLNGLSLLGKHERTGKLYWDGKYGRLPDLLQWLPSTHWDEAYKVGLCRRLIDLGANCVPLFAAEFRYHFRTVEDMM